MKHLAKLTAPLAFSLAFLLFGMAGAPAQAYWDLDAGPHCPKTGIKGILGVEASICPPDYVEDSCWVGGYMLQRSAFGTCSWCIEVCVKIELIVYTVDICWTPDSC